MDNEPAVRAYISQVGHGWPQIVEADNGALHQLYRVAGYPTKLLIGRDGRIVTAHMGGLLGDREALDRAIATAIRARP